MSDTNFDVREEIFCTKFEEIAKTLVGFETRYQMMSNHLRMMLAPEKLDEWAGKFHKRKLPLCELMRQRHPLFLLSGDVGTGKTVTAECTANRMAKEAGKPGFLFKLGAQVRGRGLHGEMTQKVRDAFEELQSIAGKKRLAFLIIDEADAVAALRDTEQMHQEEKSAVNTMIQRIDQIRDGGGRVVVFLCTNRAHTIDQAIVRRAALHITFNRPNGDERIELLTRDLNGLGLSEQDIKALADLIEMKHKCPGYTYSDFRLRLYPHAVAKIFPDKPLTLEVLKEAVNETAPSPEIK